VALQPDIRVTGSYGSFNTSMLALDADSGQFVSRCPTNFGGSINLLSRIAGSISTAARSGIHQVSISAERPHDIHTVLGSGGSLDQHTEPERASRAQIAQVGDNYAPQW